MVAGQSHTYPLFPAYKTRTRRGRRSESHTHTPSLPCLLDLHKAWSPVRVTHTHTPSLPCLVDPHKAWSPVSHTPSLSFLPTRPAQGVVADRSHTHTHTLSSLPTRPAQGVVADQSHTHTHTPSLPCLLDPHKAWSPVRVTHPPSLPCLRDPHKAWSPSLSKQLKLQLPGTVKCLLTFPRNIRNNYGMFTLLQTQVNPSLTNVCLPRRNVKTPSPLPRAYRLLKGL